MKSETKASSTGRSPTHRSLRIERLINQFLDAACDSSRRSILELLIPPEGQESPADYELCAGDIARQLGLAPSTTSEHLHQLLNMQLVSARKEGNMVYYRLRNHHLVRAFHELLQALTVHYATSDAPSERPSTVEG